MRICFYAPTNIFNRWTGPLLGLAYMAAHIEQQLGLSDFHLEVDPQQVIARQPDLIAISSFSEMYNQAILAARYFKETLNVPVIIGGPHISALPSSLDPSMDMGVIGEGEITMKLLLELMLQNRPLTPQTLKDIPNLVYWNEKKETEQSLKQERIENLDQLPLPKREIMQAFWPGFGETVVWEQGVYSSRGCPFTCRFCMYSQRANLVRYHSVDRVIEDIEDVIRRYPAQTHIVFYDDLFVTKKTRLKAIADAIRAEKFHHKVTFGCMAKTSFFDDEFCQILKEMNVRTISFGFESGSEPILHYLKDRHSTIAKHQEAVNLCHRYGIEVGGFFIIGSPPETQKDLARTYWFIRNNQKRISQVAIFPLLPLPGTQLWRDTEAQGLIGDGFQRWEKMQYTTLEPDKYLHLNGHYTLEEMKEAYDQWFDPMMNRTKHLGLNENQRRPFLKRYYQHISQDIRQIFPPGSRLLEINRSERDLRFALESDYDITDIFWQDFIQSPPKGTYDGVILTHVIEKIGFKQDIWNLLRQYPCPIHILFKNMACLPNLFALLQGQMATDFEDMDRYDTPYGYSLKSIERQLRLMDLQPLSINRYTYQELHGHMPPLRQLLKYISQGVDIRSFSQEANVFSYGLGVQFGQIPVAQERKSKVETLSPRT